MQLHSPPHIVPAVLHVSDRGLALQSDKNRTRPGRGHVDAPAQLIATTIRQTAFIVVKREFLGLSKNIYCFKVDVRLSKIQERLDSQRKARMFRIADAER
jgi:hypothetical protein